MAFHQRVQRLLLIGVNLTPPASSAPAQPPQRLVPLIESLSTAHERFDQRAIAYGHRYRSGFWAIYVLSALAVLCAVMPLALGWDSPAHAAHRFSGLWALAEVVVIGVVSAIYWRGHRSDWQGEWLRARTTAELTSYLPMIAPLLDFTQPSAQANWYLRLTDPGQNVISSDEISRLCEQNEALAREQLAGALSQPEFRATYARWATEVLRLQQHYHASIAARQEALLHRAHRVTGVLFGLTALAALAHLVVHSLWLSLATTFFPALAASLHGALAQSESYRLHAASERLEVALKEAIERIQSIMSGEVAAQLAPLKAAVEAAIMLILEEHQDWQMLVRPHHLPLA